MTEKRHGKGLLFIVTLVLAAGVIKYADIPFAQTVREKAASALSGAANADHVLAVFGGSAMPADTVPAESSGGADDILDRDQTLFPDTVDQTVYPMEFEHATPTSGTLTSSFGSRVFTMDLTLPRTRARPSPPSRTARCARPVNPATACTSLSITRTVLQPYTRTAAAFPPKSVIPSPADRKLPRSVRPATPPVRTCTSSCGTTARRSIPPTILRCEPDSGPRRLSFAHGCALVRG